MPETPLLTFDPSSGAVYTVRQVENGYIVKITVSGSYPVEGPEFVATDFRHLAEILREISEAQVRSVLSHFSGFDVPKYEYLGFPE